MGEATHVQGEGVCGKSLHLPFSILLSNRTLL